MSNERLRTRCVEALEAVRGRVDAGLDLARDPEVEAAVLVVLLTCCEAFRLAAEKAGRAVEREIQ